jgi:hypothetical protein
VAFANARDLRVWLLRLRTAVYLIHGQMEGWLRFGGTERCGMSSLMELRMTDEAGHGGKHFYYTREVDTQRTILEVVIDSFRLSAHISD